MFIAYSVTTTPTDNPSALAAGPMQAEVLSSAGVSLETLSGATQFQTDFANGEYVLKLTAMAGTPPSPFGTPFSIPFTVSAVVPVGTPIDVPTGAVITQSATLPTATSTV